MTVCLCVSCAIGSFAESEITIPEFTDPSLQITQSVIPTVKAGQSGLIAFELENTSFSYAAEISVTVTSDSSDVKIAPQNSIISVGALSMYGKAPIAIPVETSPNANGQYTIGVKVSCVSNKDFFTQQTYSFSGSISVVVTRGEAVMQPVIKNMRFDSTEYVAGQSPVLSFTVENPNSFAIYSVNATLSGFVDGAVDAVDPDQYFYIDRLGAK